MDWLWISLQLAFWLAAAGLFYIYLGYPLWIWRSGTGHWTTRVPSRPTCRISIVIAAYNEAATLPRKLRNLLESDVADLIDEILVGSDGSTDDTVGAVLSVGDPRIQVVPFPLRRGKPAALNALIPRCQGDIVVLADARQEFARNTIRLLAQSFADPIVGVTSGELVLRQRSDQPAAAQGIGFYWKYEKLLRQWESRANGVPGATGACYAIRQVLFKPIPEQTLLDDVAIPMVIAAQGYRTRFEAGACAYDDPATSTAQESIRKRRTIAGVAQLVTLFPHWVIPGRHPLWFEFLSHKVLRLASPLLLTITFATSAALLWQPLYRLLFVLQLALAVAAWLGWRMQQRGERSRVFGPCLMFLALNWTTVLALADACRSRYRVTWQRAAGT